MRCRMPAMYARFVDAIPQSATPTNANQPAAVLRHAMALADEANRYIDETKPWVLAKQEGADAQLQAVCTQGLNLFRVLAAMLKPVLPRVVAARRRLPRARPSRAGRTSRSRCSRIASTPTFRCSPASTRSRSTR